MDVLNMQKQMLSNVILLRRLNRGNVYFQSRLFTFSSLYGERKFGKSAKFYLNTSNIMLARPKRDRYMGYEL